VGWEVPIATDHYGHFGIEDGIKLAQALDPFNLAWLEDMVPWPYTDQYVRLKSSCKTPILTGEDIYLKEGFRDLFEKKAIAICHPDLATAGGLLETKKIGDLAMEHGIGMALHMAGNPVTLFSSVHCAAATENFLVMEHHNVDDVWYDELVTGVPKPLMDKEGFIRVLPADPGVGQRAGVGPTVEPGRARVGRSAAHLRATAAARQRKLSIIIRSVASLTAEYRTLWPSGETDRTKTASASSVATGRSWPVAASQ
jgi:L-alanine-DL-glutamate epimerase-like enolase superfamily enzyme